MSAYAGFSTAKQQNFYLEAVDRLVQLFASKITEMSDLIQDKPFKKKLMKLYYVLAKCEREKKSGPAFSKGLKELSVEYRGELGSPIGSTDLISEHKLFASGEATPGAEY